MIYPLMGLLKKPLSAGRNPFLPDQQAGQGRQEGIPDDAWKHAEGMLIPRRRGSSGTVRE